MGLGCLYLCKPVKKCIYQVDIVGTYLPSNVDKYSILFVLQLKEERRGLPYWTRSHYLSAYDVNTGHSLMTDMHIPSETPIMHQRIAVDAEGFVYCIQNHQPDNFVIAKYEIVREEM